MVLSGDGAFRTLLLSTPPPLPAGFFLGRRFLGHRFLGRRSSFSRSSFSRHPYKRLCINVLFII